MDNDTIVRIACIMGLIAMFIYTAFDTPWIWLTHNPKPKWPVPKDVILIYKYDGPVNLNIDAVSDLTIGNLNRGLVKLHSAYWNRCVNVEGQLRHKITLEFITVELDEITVSLHKG